VGCRVGHCVVDYSKKPEVVASLLTCLWPFGAFVLIVLFCALTSSPSGYICMHRNEDCAHRTMPSSADETLVTNCLSLSESPVGVGVGVVVGVGVSVVDIVVKEC
jgi:hypothetical protein